MAHPIITALRARRDLKESVLHTAQEMAHRASIYGVVRESYSYLAPKCHCCRRTVINHVGILEDKHILTKTSQRLPGKLAREVNVYKFILPYSKPWRQSSMQRPSEKIAQNLPLQNQGISPQETKEKWGTLQEDIARLQKGLRFCNSGSEAYAATCDKIAELTAMLEGGGPPP